MVQLLKKMEDNGAQAITDAVNDGSKIFKREIKKRIPLNNKNDIHLRYAVLRKKARKQKKKFYQNSWVFVGDKKVVYAKQVEWGRKLKSGKITKANHYVKNAKEEVGPYIQDHVAREILKKIGLR